MSHQTTVVTGASGFAGAHLLDLLGEGRKGRLIGWHRPGSTPPVRPGVEWCGVDITDADAVQRAVERLQPSQVYHLAGAPHVGASWNHVLAPLRANVLGTHHVIEAIRRLPTRCRLLAVSSGQIYQASDEPIDEHARLHPTSPYGVSKLAADQIALRSATDEGLDIVVARPFNHAGPGQSSDFVVSSFARQVARIALGDAPPEIAVGNLDARRDLSDVRDVVRAYIRIMEAGAAGRAYNICSGRAWRIGDLLDELIQQAGVAVTIHQDAARMRPSDAPVFQGDASRLRVELGWTPGLRVEQTLRDTLDWWRQQLRAS